VPDLVTSHNSSSNKIRSPNISAMKRRDPKMHLEMGENLFEDWNAIDLTLLNLVSPTVGANCHGL
jgi:hypothetical protein